MVMYGYRMEEACNLNPYYQPQYIVSNLTVQKCAAYETNALIYLKSAYRRFCKNDWYNVLMKMSRATYCAE